MLKRIGCLILICMCAGGTNLFAQESNFEPPRPPPLDPGSDFEEIDDEMMEDDGFRPPPPPLPGMGLNGNERPGDSWPPPPPPSFSGGASSNTAGNAINNGLPPKMKFQIVEGEFWEKGKKRTRGKKIQVR